MKYINQIINHSVFFGPFIIVILTTGLISCTGKRSDIKDEDRQGKLKIGWASVDLTPDRPVLLQGQFYARVSEGVLDPVTATALAFEYGSGEASEKAIMISCDLVSINDGGRDGSGDNLRDNVRNLLKKSIPGINPEQIFLNATHTHTAPNTGSGTDIKSMHGVELDVMTPAECQKYISERIARAAEEAWKNRKPGGISYGLGQAVVGHNRHTVDIGGKSVMYKNANFPEFSHVEGYEDHSVNLLYTWDNDIKLTGIIINVPCPSQVTEGLFQISADYWHDTRMEVRNRLGNIYILPQCSAAGDQAPHIQVGARAEERMQRLMVHDSIKSGRSSMAQRKQIAIRIADAVTSVLPYMKDNIDWDPVFVHRMEVVELSRRKAEVVDRSAPDATRKLLGLVDTNTPESYEKIYKELLQKSNEDPEFKKNPRWYVELTNAYAKMRSSSRIPAPSEHAKQPARIPVEVHVVRIGDIVIATNPFELYLDYGIRIKGRSPAVQTFLVQLAGRGSYLPASRAVAGGSYGAATTTVGPEGGQELVEKTLEMINAVWQKN